MDLQKLKNDKNQMNIIEQKEIKNTLAGSTPVNYFLFCCVPFLWNLSTRDNSDKEQMLGKLKVFYLYEIAEFIAELLHEPYNQDWNPTYLSEPLQHRSKPYVSDHKTLTFLAYEAEAPLDACSFSSFHQYEDAESLIRN